MPVTGYLFPQFLSYELKFHTISHWASQLEFWSFLGIYIEVPSRISAYVLDVLK